MLSRSMRYIHTIKINTLLQLHVKQFVSGKLALQVLLELLPPPLNQYSQLVVLGGIQYHGLSWGQVILLVSPLVGPPCLLTLRVSPIESTSLSLQNSLISLGGEGAPVPVHTCQVSTFQHFNNVGLSCYSQGLDGLALDPVRSPGKEEFVNQPYKGQPRKYGLHLLLEFPDLPEG